MEFIVPFKGKVKFKIVLDPTVWIFDDRRIDLDTYFSEDRIVVDETEEYKRGMGEHWSREIMEGATVPQTLKTEKRYNRKEKNEMITGTFGILFAPFLKNAEPDEDAATVIFETAHGEFAFPINEAKELIFKFSEKGKPLKENGPVHILHNDGSNQENPITDVFAIRVE
ncbi:peptidyl-prolyl cis-trans isomerase [Planococcus shenhongbingii]|uniref:Peptidyl-prolyl cis-trans isomerase n=1 Tax=Planococcus shenhongbingii TaxID=3058398 RepID=A0ABT8N8U1_9BACL|nr:MULTISPECIES: peptidyl-prolyl cis-trans isomerase [unclassified Planococcus (in: firmicutes)]MDN7244308.1 peptidyl-prolyl cis-trans isomerase [Planococcus sp. N017]WKA57477.1 peptidyl-prolyl cis-trans isomerase [Planococcus sp. N016]